MPEMGNEPGETTNPDKAGRRKRHAGTVDGLRGAPLEYPPPVADWLAFLAERLAADFLKEVAEGETTP